MKTIILVLALCTSAFAVDISGGITDYIPTLEQIHDRYDFEDDPSGWYGRLRVEKDWYVIATTYTSYKGRGEIDLDIHGLEVTYIAELPENFTPYVGVGPTVFYMRRDIRSTVYNDYPWGIHGIMGVRASMGALGVDMGVNYSWSRTSTLGGREYDLGDMRWYAGITLGD